ncbi:MAG: FAD-dependent oxidoreductase [Spirochaetes bacterium]|nr:FAD-dependent oxidoreductase [Spirochaetota bacterium]
MEVLDKILGCSLGKGAGISGPAIARRLSAHAVSGALVERAADVSFGVSKANSGIIRAAFHHKSTTLKARLEAAGNPMFDRLQAATGSSLWSPS